MANDEFSLIRQWTRRSDGQEGDALAVGIGDDAAVYAPTPAMEVVACCDAMVETVHFLKETMHPGDIGYKAVVSNVSDVAAMGGLARYALVSIAVSPGWSAEQTSQIYDGIYEACEAYGVRLIGGDTVSAPDALYLSVTVLGEVEAGRAIRRSGARPGQVVFVTGHVGSSAAGLHLLLRQRQTGERIPAHYQPLVAAHQRPAAQVAAGRLLQASRACGALNDVSDGLASELWEIAEASRVELYVDAGLVPIREETLSCAEEAGKDPLDWAFYGGEDYQLVGTAEAGSVAALSGQFVAAGIPFAVIGRVEASAAEASVTVARAGRQMPLPKGGFNHFGRRE